MNVNIFDELSASVSEKVQKMDKVEEVTIENFISSILPKAESIEVLFENRHSYNLVSLIAPVDPDSKTMFKWNNNFSWSYAGELADSIKERVKRAGGSVNGDLRCSLSWFNGDDLDLHMKEPTGYEIFYGNRNRPSTSGGTLDVDMNAGHAHTRTPVENITYDNRRTMREGVYHLVVNQFTQREMKDVGFEVEIEFDGTIYSFSYPKALSTKENVVVAEIKYSKANGFEIVKSLPSSQTSKTVWSLPTQTFRKVNVVMMSPNYWDDRAVGNKHYFFMLDGCSNEDKARGFFNEFLIDELTPYRKVFEVVGSKMKTEESDQQLSGLGFSSTQRNYVLCRVKGSFSRTVKITF
jgi:signal recognition particle subunit SEC65